MRDYKQTNIGYLKRYGGEVAKNVTSFATIRSFGDKNKATTHDGLTVVRQESIYVEGYGMVRCAPMTLHFIFEDKSKKVGRWLHMCTCGSISGIVSYKELTGLISPELGEYVLICVQGLASKQNTGIFRHADGSTE